MNKVRLITFVCIASLLLVAVAFPAPVVKVDSKLAKSSQAASGASRTS